MLRVVSSDGATVRLLCAAESDSWHHMPLPQPGERCFSSHVPLPKQMALMGCEALEATEVSYNAAASAAKVMSEPTPTPTLPIPLPLPYPYPYPHPYPYPCPCPYRYPNSYPYPYPHP